jgi:hypothetical protein
MLLYNLMSNRGVDTENAENGKVSIVLTSTNTGTGKAQ